MLGRCAHQKVICLNDHTVRVICSLDARKLEYAALGLEVRIVAVDLSDCPGTLDQDCSFAVVEVCGCLIVGVTCCGLLEVLGEFFELLACLDAVVIGPVCGVVCDCRKVNALAVTQITGYHGQAPCRTRGTGNRGIACIFDLLARIEQLGIGRRNLYACRVKDLGVVEAKSRCKVRRNCHDLSIVCHSLKNTVCK